MNALTVARAAGTFHQLRKRYLAAAAAGLALAVAAGIGIQQTREGDSTGAGAVPQGSGAASAARRLVTMARTNDRLTVYLVASVVILPLH